MESPSSSSFYSSSSLSSSSSPSEVDSALSDFGFSSDSEGECRGAHGSRSEAGWQRGSQRPGPLRCCRRPLSSSGHQVSSCLEGPGFASPMAGSGMKRSRDSEEETCLNTQNLSTEGDRLFAQKCKELQGFIRPLTDLLNGLKMGRYERGLSSFQQSVAMDRIQRIVGVLQKPEMGERYLGTLLQVESMLKTWFPHIASQRSPSEDGKHRFQSKRLASSQTYPTGPLAHLPRKELNQIQLRQQDQGKEKLHSQEQELPHLLPEWPAMNLTWIHTSPICNPPLSSLGSATFSHGLLGPGARFGVILFLQHGAQSFAYSAPTTPVRDATVSPVVCDGPKNLPEEGPRCYSLPVSLASTPLTSEWSRALSSPCLPTAAREMTTIMDEKQALHFC
ncbi:circadian-associated transcriptional repressor-like isoform X1 [Vombatus ursinus]|uniref:circadian-associated transcriptional repressor-like n=2 Tax=Vombatus ursinus TaxID=29139 RepID=UPI000FFD1189|nr:circadian-associated transcriptional repressor-like [Vombatus ursinus]XP_027718012.1 circadian-associated transcriptional repressor-like [Vombatus ursinus]XP_027718013.1 circadian-associated transcriptional repressor-like [Vombatus ursinus]XP_027718014.1 circadian-associated transcriptional repressor-like isoform X1 [Vombatus ursinus]XP_027718015.1 circadian-associated transcriptional repressor-like isoform X1 [Vombatus ursinus]XP_027718016.1 circadian-associated transcriptional repressor-l